MDFGPAISRLGIICYTPLLKNILLRKKEKRTPEAKPITISLLDLNSTILLIYIY